MSAELYLGSSCKYGHVGWRFKSTRNCVECNKERGRKANMTADQILRRAEVQRATYWSDPVAARERMKESGAKHYEKHKVRLNAEAAQFVHIRKIRTPPWANIEKIKEIYINCPDGYEVDHVIPLQGRLVSGLHVETNLQYLTQFENRSKGNRFE